jgi:hypothetical protein
MRFSPGRGRSADEVVWQYEEEGGDHRVEAQPGFRRGSSGKAPPNWLNKRDTSSISSKSGAQALPGVSRSPPVAEARRLIPQVETPAARPLQQVQHNGETGPAIGFVGPVGAAGGIAMSLQTGVVVMHDLQVTLTRIGHRLRQNWTTSRPKLTPITPP